MREAIRCSSLLKTFFKGHKYIGLIKRTEKEFTNRLVNNQLTIWPNSNQQNYSCGYRWELLGYNVFYNFLEGCEITQTPGDMKIIYKDGLDRTPTNAVCCLFKDFHKFSPHRVSSTNYVSQFSIALAKIPEKNNLKEKKFRLGGGGARL